MSFPRYPNYKDSGVDWLGKVPEHWKVTPLKYLSSLKGRLGWQGLRADEYTEDGPLLVTSEHIADDRIEWHRCYHVSVERFGFAPEIQLRPHDVLMMKDGAAMGKLAYVDDLPGPACLNSHLILFRPVNGQFVNRFLFYVLGGPSFKTYMLRERAGSTFFGISQESIGAFPFAVPPIHEQHQILSFLDRETAKIDELAREQQRLIDLLAEKRPAVISHTVTKGLNPRVRMKPSSIKWLGDIPAHWEVGALKRYWSVVDCKHLTAEFVEDGIPLASIREVQGRWVALEDAKCTTEHYYEMLIEGGRRPLPGDLIFSRNATVGEVGQVSVDHPRFAMGQDVVLLRKLLPTYSSDYLQHVIRSPIIIQQLATAMIGSTFKRINVEEIRSFIVPLPPPTEQAEIAAFLEGETARFDTLTVEAQCAIDLLQERRTALISAAVTGQIDARHLAEAQPT